MSNQLIFRKIWTRLNRKIFKIAQLLFNFFSIVAPKFSLNLSAYTTFVPASLIIYSALVWSDPTIVKVGAYDFPPFVLWKQGKAEGLAVDMVELMNEAQTDYRFNLVETSPNRRYSDFENKVFDLILFENQQWGWDRFKAEIDSSLVFMKGGEVFISRKMNQKKHPKLQSKQSINGQEFFKKLKNKSIRGILGYHYAFVGYSTSPEVLKNWNLQLTDSHEGNILAVLEGRSDLAIVTKEFLDIYLKKNPSYLKHLLVSEFFDQKYQHSILLRKTGVIKVTELNQILSKLLRSSKLQNRFEEKGIDPITLLDVSKVR